MVETFMHFKPSTDCCRLYVVHHPDQKYHPDQQRMDHQQVRKKLFHLCCSGNCTLHQMIV